MHDSIPTDEKRTESPTDSDSAACPRCGEPILGIATAGPGANYAQPCGCNLSDHATAALAGSDGDQEERAVRTDGGTPAATRTTENVDVETETSEARAVAWSDVTAFQQHCLLALAALEAGDVSTTHDDPHGLDVKGYLDAAGWGYDEINHGRLYPNLDDLVRRGLVEKTEARVDLRTNAYTLTDAGDAFLATVLEEYERILDLRAPTEDGGA